MQNYIGSPPNCRPECTSNFECAPNRACVKEKCADPCPGSCGSFTTCQTLNHQPICTCQVQYTGDPFSGCYPIKSKSSQDIFSLICYTIVLILLENVAYLPVETIEPCNPTPCGPNAVCKEKSGAGSCTCLPEYHGDPYIGCRPECVLNTDCDKSRACVNNKCKDPCPGVCGRNAECHVVNHSPQCECISGYTGNPSIACNEIPKSRFTKILH